MKAWRIDKTKLSTGECWIENADPAQIDSVDFAYRATEKEALEYLHTLAGVKVSKLKCEIADLHDKREPRLQQLESVASGASCGVFAALGIGG